MRLRSLMCGLAFVGMAQGSHAADLGEFLRGSTVVSQPGEVRWDGVYFGGQVGTTIAGADFSATTGELSNLLRIGPINTPTASPLGAVDRSGGTQYGGFVGYNSQWDGAVIGIEANHAHMNNTVSATNAMTGTYASADGVTTNPYAATGTASVRFTDYGTLRVRGGWAAGMFMPYATFGLAVARADFNRSISATFTPPANSGFVFTTPFTPLTLATTFSGYAYGYSLGAGLDVMLTNCFFLRAEYEYASFGDFQQVNMHLHNARIAAAFKF